MHELVRPTYDIARSYDYNFEHGPFYEGEYPLLESPAETSRLLDFTLRRPLGVAAGLLLNSKWVRLYANLGFDLLTYKTVRSARRRAHPHPNCLYVESVPGLDPDEESAVIGVDSCSDMPVEDITITNSFGVPSADPDFWRQDVSVAKSYLRGDQVLIVSVVGSSEHHETLDDYIKDFVTCAVWAKEAGADIVELDLSCPNSPVREGEVYRNAGLASHICREVKESIAKTPLFIKVGYFASYEEMGRDIGACAPFVDGVAGINSIKKRVCTLAGTPALGGRGRDKSGICGAMIRELGLQAARRLVRLRREGCYHFAIIGIGGAMTPEHVDEYFGSGVDAVQVVTAAMFDPHLAAKYAFRREGAPGLGLGHQA